MGLSLEFPHLPLAVIALLLAFLFGALGAAGARARGRLFTLKRCLVAQIICGVASLIFMAGIWRAQSWREAAAALLLAYFACCAGTRAVISRLERARAGQACSAEAASKTLSPEGDREQAGELEIAVGRARLADARPD